MEYGLPSSHALNTVCLMGYTTDLIWIGVTWKELTTNAASDQCRYLLHYVLAYGEHGSVMVAAGLSLAVLLVMLVGIGELVFFKQMFFSTYQKILTFWFTWNCQQGYIWVCTAWLMLLLGLVLALSSFHSGWLSMTMLTPSLCLDKTVHPYTSLLAHCKFWSHIRTRCGIESWNVSSQFAPFAVASFWAGLSLLMCFAYPKPEFPTPSFEYHTAFNGVAFGIVRTLVYSGQTEDMIHTSCRLY